MLIELFRFSTIIEPTDNAVASIIDFLVLNK